MLFQIPNMSDEIGDAIAEDLFHDAILTPKAGGAPRNVRVGYEAAYIKVDALGNDISGVQAYASGLVTVIGDARSGDILEIYGKRWSLKSGPEPYGGGNLCRVGLASIRD